MATKPVVGVNDAARTDRAPADRGRAALDTLVRAHRERVARLAGRLLGWSPDVEEVVQEVFVSALTAMGGFRGRSSIETWLSRITINKCRSHQRRGFLRLRLLKRFASGQVATTDRPADAGTHDRERFEHVRAAVRALPPKYREVIVLRYLEELPTPEICEWLRLRANTVEVRLHRARAMLRDSLGGDQGLLDER